jgi:hypothetical protein
MTTGCRDPHDLCGLIRLLRSRKYPTLSAHHFAGAHEIFSAEWKCAAPHFSRRNIVPLCRLSRRCEEGAPSQLSFSHLLLIPMSFSFWILLSAVVVTVILFLAGKHLDAFSFKKNPGTALATVFMLLSWVMMLLVYGKKDLSFSWALVATDAGSAALFCAGYLLLRGNKHFSGFDTTVLIPFFALCAWDYFLGEYVSGPGKTLLSVICLSPSLLLSQIAMVLLGWAFVVRWGWYGLIFGILCLLHAVLQLPTYIALNLSGDFQLTPPDKEQFRQVMDALGLLKAPLAYGFLAFLASPARPNFDELSVLPPAESVAPSKIVFIPITILLVGVGGNVVANVITSILPSFHR